MELEGGVDHPMVPGRGLSGAHRSSARRQCLHALGCDTHWGSNFTSFGLHNPEGFSQPKSQYKPIEDPRREEHAL